MIIRELCLLSSIMLSWDLLGSLLAMVRACRHRSSYLTGLYVYLVTTCASVLVTRPYWADVIHDHSLNQLARNWWATTLPIWQEPSRHIVLAGSFPPYSSYIQYLFRLVQQTLVIVPIALATVLAPVLIQVGHLTWLAFSPLVFAKRGRV